MRWCLPALLLAACSGKPYEPFDRGFDVHFILVTEGKPLKVKPVCTAGLWVAKSGEERTLQPAAEVAIMRVPPGDHRLSVWDPKTKSGGRVLIGVDNDLWVIHWVEPDGGNDGRIAVYRKPPHERLTRGWAALAPVPR